MNSSLAQNHSNIDQEVCESDNYEEKNRTRSPALTIQDLLETFAF